MQRDPLRGLCGAEISLFWAFKAQFCVLCSKNCQRWHWLGTMDSCRETGRFWHCPQELPTGSTAEPDTQSWGFWPSFCSWKDLEGVGDTFPTCLSPWFQTKLELYSMAFPWCLTHQDLHFFHLPVFVRSLLFLFTPNSTSLSETPRVDVWQAAGACPLPSGPWWPWQTPRWGAEMCCSPGHPCSRPPHPPGLSSISSLNKRQTMQEWAAAVLRSQTNLSGCQDRNLGSPPFIPSLSLCMEMNLPSVIC